MKKSLMLILLIICMPFSYSVEVEDVSEPDNLREVSDGLTRYVYGAGLVASVKNSEVNYYHSDRLGSNRVASDSSGATEKEFKSLPFGQEIENSGVRYAFATGKELDSSDLYYFGARYYDSDLGRFTSVDPVKENEPYSYVMNNPLMFVDSDGRDASVYYGLGYSPSQIYGSRQFTPAWGMSGDRELFGADIEVGLNFIVSGNSDPFSWVHPIYASYNLDFSIPFFLNSKLELEHSSEHSQSNLLENSDISLISKWINTKYLGASTDLISLNKNVGIGDVSVGIAGAIGEGSTNTLLDMGGPITLIDPIIDSTKHSGIFGRYKTKGKYGEFSIMGIYDFYYEGDKQHFGAIGYTSPEISLDRTGEEGLSLSSSFVANTDENWQVGSQINFEF